MGSDETTVTLPVGERVDAVFARLARGELQPRGLQPESGWEMSLPSGAVVVRSTLQAEAAELIAAGPDAVPALLRWATHDNLALRYVALFALQQITGEAPFVPYFAKDDDEGHLAKAITVWKAWHESRPAAP